GVREARIWAAGEDRSSAGSSPCELASRGERVSGLQIDRDLPSGPRSLLVNAALLPAMHGRPATIVLPFQDITELKRTEEALRISEQRALGAERQLRHGLDLTRALSDSLGEGVLAMDREGRVFMANPAAA